MDEENNLDTIDESLEANDVSLTDMIKESRILQNEINSIFDAFVELNNQVKDDIDEFCNICESSIVQDK
ncbi:hypothetical protein KAFR_0H02110 [Kazachstania africana CBS 2517]|uniref:Uncharacterized protein n=1 Tax=Kazachstania africana (strain ATCC 22294 / BCRC 22015 / CBS 2517 / CECT 1963 / NBRC 1671 / NRRL Y-8276) TaxID=1071382 RepID=H2AZ64_KAZAF|nr:hypothetical protein KAFR_0H02110 [Kazachstania africana CBS 2517]CCF59620.1 hypothetical protein KAFR_0H02110 [Kazachstania africana CBS 2517]